MTISVVIADDQPLIRAGIAMLINAEPDLQVVAEASHGRQAIELARQHRPDVVVMDARMPELDGVSATRALTQEQDQHADHLTRVLVLTMFNEDEVVYGALQAGASGFLLKHAAPQDLATAVRRVAHGDSWIDPASAGTVIAALASRATTSGGPPEPGHQGAHGSTLVDRLTPREREIMVLMAHGLSNGEICARLFLSLATVKTHVARVIMKTGCRDRAQAVALAYRCGLVTPSSRLPGQPT